MILYSGGRLDLWSTSKTRFTKNLGNFVCFAIIIHIVNLRDKHIETLKITFPFFIIFDNFRFQAFCDLNHTGKFDFTLTNSLKSKNKIPKVPNNTN